MMHKAWSSIEEVPNCFWRSSVKFQGHTALKSVKFDPDWAFPDSNSSLNSPMATKWCTKLEEALKSSVTHCFWRSSVKFQGHTALKSVKFDPDWAFPDSNSSLNSPMATKWCTKLEEALKSSVTHCFWRSSVKFQGHTTLKSVKYDQDLAFPDSNSSLNSPMATKWCTKLEVAK